VLIETEPLLQMMSIEQKAAQMLMVSYPWTEMTRDWETFFRKCQVGGVILNERNFQTVAQVRSLIEGLQDFARETAVGIPLYVAIEQEGGSASPLSFARAIHPGNMAIGATRNSEYAYEAARLCANELRSFGFTMNLAPVADINHAYTNPVVGPRAFGEREDMVTQMTVKTVKGLQENGIAACARHFPGLGRVVGECYDDLASVGQNEETFTGSDFKPFVQAIAARVDAIMVAVAAYTGMDRDGFPAALSTKLVTNILRNTLNFKGVIVSDQVDCKAILDRIPIQEAATLAVRAGIDLILSKGTLENVAHLFVGIVDGLNKRYYGPERVEEAATRILKAKFRRSIDPVPFRDDPTDLMNRIARDSVTLVRNEEGLLPLKLDAGEEGEHWIGVLSPHPPNRDMITLGEGLQGKHTWVEEVQYDPAAEDLDWQEISDKFGNCETLILVTSSPALLNERQVDWLNRIIGLEKPTVLVSLQNPYHLMHFPAMKTYLATYGHSPSSLEALVDVLLGEANPRGRLPITIPEVAEYGEGVGYGV